MRKFFITAYCVAIAVLLCSCIPVAEEDTVQCKLYRISDNHFENYDSLVNAHVIVRNQRTINITLGLFNNGSNPIYIPFKGFEKESFCSELLIGYGKKTFPVKWSSSSNFRNNIIQPHDTVGLFISIRNWMLSEMGIEDSVSLATIQNNLFFVHRICKEDSLKKDPKPYKINIVDKTSVLQSYRDTSEIRRGVISD